ncbi:MAG TPA: hypothetical protein VNE58_08755 [Casimicrobiaceae bacterium]|nr:hypothetical protein [Casimicrobiaceae bacterium]
MTEPDASLTVLRFLQVILAIPLLSLVGQGVVAIFASIAGQEPQNNFFYRLLGVVASPFVMLARLVTPRFVPDRRVPFVALCLLAAAYVWVMLAIVNACHERGLPVRQCLSG